MVSLDKIIISNNQPIGSNSLWIKPNLQKNGVTQMAFYVPYDKNKYTEVVGGSTISNSGGVALDFNKLNLEYDSESKKIKFTFPTSETTIKDFEIDCTDFIKDGMVNDVQFSEETGKINIIFNTDSGKDSIELDAYKMFKLLSGEDTDTISLSIDNNKISASIKSDSISEELLNDSVKNNIRNAYGVIEFKDPALKTYLLNHNIGGTIIPNEITIYEAEHTAALPSFASTSFLSLDELYYFRNVINKPSFRYLKTDNVTFYNHQLDFIYGAGQSDFTKITLVNVSSMGSMALRGCTALKTVIVLGSFANMASTVTYDNTNPTWYIQDDLYDSFIVVNSDIAGEKKKFSEYYDKVQILEGTEDGTIHVSGKEGLSKDVKVTGWDELAEKIEILSNSTEPSISETVKVMTLADYNNLENVDSNVVYFIIENPSSSEPEQDEEGTTAN